MEVKVFNSPLKVTQTFGNKLIIDGKEYYPQFGLLGHEGLDCVPQSTDWTVHTLPYPGIVVKDIDIPGKIYGIQNTIWYPEIEEAWMYCHLASNRVFIDQKLPPVIPLGVMGGTGNVMGSHLHINRFKVDARGYRLNKDNGYLGGIDPLPLLLSGQESSEGLIDDDKKRGIDVFDKYRFERQQGPEGNYQGYVNSVIGSDKSVIGLNSKISVINGRLDKLTVAHKLEIESIKEELEKTNDTEKEKLNEEWQTKVNSAKKLNIDKFNGLELISMGISKWLKKVGGET